MFTRTVAAVGTAMLFVGVAASAQTPQPPSNTNTPMKLVGCIVKESDYRKAHNLGDGALNGVGLGDELVIVNAMSVPGNAVSTAPDTKASPSSFPTCAEQSGGVAYRLTGKYEDGMKKFAGHRMEISGTFEHASDAQAAANPSSTKLPAEIVVSFYGAPSSAPAPAVAATTPTRTPASVEARNEPGAQTPITSTTPERRLPRTASTQPLIVVAGLGLVIAALSLGGIRRRAR